MIDRKSFLGLILLCLAMIAAAVWRLSLLSDWTSMPMIAPHGMVQINGLILFTPPLALLFVIGTLLVQKWLISGPKEALATWYRHGSVLPMMSGVFFALMQAFVISRSFGYGRDLNPLMVSRAVMAVTGILTMMLGNVVPKLPTLSKRFGALNLNPWQSARHARFGGRLTVAFGLILTIAAFVLPIRGVVPLFLPLTVAFFGALIWHKQKLKSEPSSMV